MTETEKLREALEWFALTYDDSEGLSHEREEAARNLLTAWNTRPSVVPAELGLAVEDASDDEEEIARVLCRRAGDVDPNDLISVNDGPVVRAWRYFVPRARSLLASQEG